MHVLFAGTPEFAAIALQAIVQAGFHVPLVLTQPDRRQGRGMNLRPSAVKQMAQAFNLPICQPDTLRGNEAVWAQLRAAQADVMVVAAYGLILPQAVLDTPRHGCLNIHASLLPRWRGAAPIQRAIEAGDAETGVCIMQMDAGLDTGAVVSRHVCPIHDTDTAAVLHDRLAEMGARAIVADLQRLRDSGSLNATAQTEQGVCYAAKIQKTEAQLDWTQPYDVLLRKIRALNPAPAAYTRHRGQNWKIWQAEAAVGTGASGTLLAADPHGIVVACGQGALRITELQAAGGKRLSAAAFLAGHPLHAGDTLGD